MDVPFPPSAFGDRVQLYARQSGTNTGGGKVATFVKTGPALPCRIVRLGGKDKDLDVVTQRQAEYELSFPRRPGGVVRDAFDWLDTTGEVPSGVLERFEIIESAVPSDPDGRLWRVIGVLVQ